MMRSLVIGCILMLVTGCSASRSLVVTGESLRGIGNEFVQVATIYKQGCDVTKIIAQPHCQKFRTFGEQFQKSFPLAVQLWEAARSANDSIMQDKITKLITGLATDLSEFAVLAIQNYGGK